MLGQPPAPQWTQGVALSLNPQLIIGFLRRCHLATISAISPVAGALLLSSSDFVFALLVARMHGGNDIADFKSTMHLRHPLLETMHLFRPSVALINHAPLLFRCAFDDPLVPLILGIYQLLQQIGHGRVDGHQLLQVNHRKP